MYTRDPLKSILVLYSYVLKFCLIPLNYLYLKLAIVPQCAINHTNQYFNFNIAHLKYFINITHTYYHIVQNSGRGNFGKLIISESWQGKLWQIYNKN